MSEFNVESDVIFGYGIAKEYLGCRVRVYLYNGSVLGGTLQRAVGKFIWVDAGTGKDALINLDHVTSITRQ